MRSYLIAVLLMVSLAFAAFGGDITPNGMGQGDLYTFLSNVVTMCNEIKSDLNAYRTEHNNICLGFSGLASDTAAVQTTVTFPYRIGNLTYQKAAASGIALTGSALSSGTQALYLFSVNAAGTATCTAGTAVANSATPVWPSAPSGYCPFGGIKLSTANGTFTPATTVFGIENQTVTFYNLSGYPSGTSATSDVSTTDLTLSNL